MHRQHLAWSESRGCNARAPKPGPPTADGVVYILPEVTERYRLCLTVTSQKTAVNFWRKQYFWTFGGPLYKNWRPHGPDNYTPKVLSRGRIISAKTLQRASHTVQLATRQTGIRKKAFIQNVYSTWNTLQRSLKVICNVILCYIAWTFYQRPEKYTTLIFREKKLKWHRRSIKVIIDGIIQ